MTHESAVGQLIGFPSEIADTDRHNESMNVKDLKYLIALAEHRHFGKAADACFVSQPTLSAQIKKLESFLGAPLVERAPRNVSLTSLGVRVV